MPDTILKQWMRRATPDERQELAHDAGTTSAYLNHMAAPLGSKYRREPSPILAASIERKTVAMAKSTKGRLPAVYRTDLVAACAQCEFAQRCLGAKAIRAEFDPVPDEAADTEA